MAKKSMVARDVKRAKIVNRFATKRAALKAMINDRGASIEQIDSALLQLQKLPRDASPPARCDVVGSAGVRTPFIVSLASAEICCARRPCP